MQEQSAGREAYDSDLQQLQSEIDQLREEQAQQRTSLAEQDYYGNYNQYNNDNYYYRGRCDRDDLDDLDDLLDDLDDGENLSNEDYRDLRRLLRRCSDDGLYDLYDNFDEFFDEFDDNRIDDNDFFDRYYSDRRYCRLHAFDYADNFRYDDYLRDIHQSGRCGRYFSRTAFDDYFGNFEERYQFHNTSYNPYSDVLHELDDEDFYKYGPGAYRSWNDWCRRNSRLDGTLPRWCHERKRFLNSTWD